MAYETFKHPKGDLQRVILLPGTYAYYGYDYGYLHLPGGDKTFCSPSYAKRLCKRLGIKFVHCEAYEEAPVDRIDKRRSK